MKVQIVAILGLAATTLAAPIAGPGENAKESVDQDFSPVSWVYGKGEKIVVKRDADADAGLDNSLNAIKRAHGHGKKIEVKRDADANVDEDFTPIQWVYGKGEKIVV